MAKRRNVLLVAAGVTALLAVVGAASNGRPLSLWGRGGGPTATFFDYAFTTFLLMMAAGLAIAVYTIAHSDRSALPRKRQPLWKSMVTFIALCALALVIAHYGHVAQRLRHHAHAQQVQAGRRRGSTLDAKVHGGRSAAVRWDEVAFFAVLAAAGVAYVLRRRATRPLSEFPDPLLARLQMTAVLDDAVDDLRNERDVRRAIIAAYARMELALAAHGLPRRRSEAPREFLERVLPRLDVSSSGARRLTDLFVWAKFSHHDPEPGIKDEAIDALLAVRDELREPAEAVA